MLEGIGLKSKGRLVERKRKTVTVTNNGNFYFPLSPFVIKVYLYVMN